jgi:hypothetical protein
MSYFAAALVALMTAEGLMAAGYGYPAAAIEAPETLILVHIVTIGWLSILMCGALFQFVPVLIARPLYSDALPLPTLGLLLTGLVALVLGFLQLAGHAPAHFAFFPAAAVLLGSGFALVLWNLGRTLWSARPLPLPARFVVVGLFSVGATVFLGIAFALVLGGATSHSHFVTLTSAGVPIHVIAGLGGWLTFTALGVSYRLLAMFMLAPELSGATTRGAFYVGTAAIAVAIIGGVAAVCAEANLQTVLSVAAILGLGAFLLYARDMQHIYRARKRRTIELNSRMAAVALGHLAAVVILIAVLLSFGALRQHVAAVVFLTCFGWLSGLVLAKLYKIVAFLTWLECYGPVLGKAPTPRVQDLVVEGRALKWFVLYFVMVWVATAALLLGEPLAFRASAGVMLIATVGIVAQIVRIRRLADVSATARLPDGVHAPRLLFSLVKPV